MFDWIFTFFTGLWTAGAYIDGWAHTHLESSLESFFTPWHAVFYFGLFATGVSLVVCVWINHKKGYPLRFALPKEYIFAFIGLIISFVAGVGDMLWHLTFGIEVGVEALLSPTHLLLAIGGAVMVAGPLSAVWYRHKSHPIHSGPTILSAAYFLAVITFMFQFLHPFNMPWMAESFFLKNPIPIDFAVALGVANIVFFTVTFVGLALSTVRHWVFPFGSFTIILFINTLAATLMESAYYQFIWTALIAGILIDILYYVLIRRGQRSMHHIHLFSFWAPFILVSVYMATIYVTDTIAWSIHTWTGSIFIAGIFGYLMSHLVIPFQKS